jgi:hypothetical protein
MTSSPRSNVSCARSEQSTIDVDYPLFADAAARLIEARRLGWQRLARPEDLRLLRVWRDEIMGSIRD